MPAVIAIASQKGGVAKTTTSGNLGHALTRLGKRVLLVDLDAQMNLTTWLGLGDFTGPTSDAVMIAPDQLERAPGPTVAGAGLDLIYASDNLAGAQISLQSTAKNPYTILRRALRTLDSRYDVVLLDCPPSLGLLVVNALVAADAVIVPVVPQSFAIDGLNAILTALEELVREEVIAQPPAVRAALTIYDAFDREQAKIVQSMRERTDVVVFERLVRKAPLLAQGPDRRKTIFDLAPDSAGAQDYAALALEVVS